MNKSREKLGIINNTTHHSVHKDRWSLQKDKVFSHPIQNTPSKLYWFNSPHRDSGKIKLLIPTTTYFRRMMLTTHGTTQSFCYLLVPDQYDPEIVLNNVNNMLFDYINECFRYANWNSVPILRSMPNLPLDKRLTDEDIFDYFSISDSERNHIRKTITWR